MKNLLVLIAALACGSVSMAKDKAIVVCESGKQVVSIYDYEGEGVRATLAIKSSPQLRGHLLGTSSPIKTVIKDSTVTYLGPGFKLDVVKNISSSPKKGTGRVIYTRMNRNISWTQMSCKLY